MTEGTPAGTNLYFQLLGPIRAWVGAIELPLGPPKQRAVLALLLLARQTVVRDRTIIRTIWDDDPPPRAASTIHVYVSRIRRTLHQAPPTTTRLLRVSSGYRLVVPPTSVDFQRFTTLLDQARAHQRAGHLEDALAKSQHALELWQDDALADLDDALRERLKVHIMGRHLRLAVIEYAELSQQLGFPEAAVPRLEELAEVDPTDEPVHARLIATYAAAGRQAAALEAYERVRLALAHTLGIDPSDHLKEAHLRVLRS